MHTAAHQIIHDVIAGCHRIEHIADQPGLFRATHSAESEIDILVAEIRLRGSLTLAHADRSVICCDGPSVTGFSGYADAGYSDAQCDTRNCAGRTEYNVATRYRPAPEDPVSEDGAPEDGAPEDWAPEDWAPEDWVPEDPTS